MKDRLRSWTDIVASSAGEKLPEGRLKEFLRSHFYRHYNALYALSKIIDEAELLLDGTLLVQLNDGTRFYGMPDETLSPLTRYADARKSGKLKEFKHFSSSLQVLCNQYIADIYEINNELKKGDIVVDIGAHVGVFTVKAAKLVGTAGKVIAIEPELNNLGLLKENIQANEVGNVVIVPKGVWSKQGKAKLYLAPSKSGHSFVYGDDADKFTEIEVDTLDNILKELGVTRVDFIKVDIEGAEIEALKGMEQTLKHDNVKLAIEAAHIVSGKRTYKTVASQLREMGFEVHIKRGMMVYAGKGTCP